MTIFANENAYNDNVGGGGGIAKSKKKTRKNVIKLWIIS